MMTIPIDLDVQLPPAPTLADWIAAYLRAHPDTCPHCLGTGEIDVPDPQTGWDTLPCPDCAPPDEGDEPPF